MNLEERASIEMLMILHEKSWVPARELRAALKERAGWPWGAGTLVSRTGGGALFLRRGATKNMVWGLSEVGWKRAKRERPGWRVKTLKSRPKIENAGTSV